MTKSVRTESLINNKVRLSRRHAEIDARVLELEQRRALTSEESFELHQLKKEKLRTKDELSSLGGGNA